MSDAYTPPSSSKANPDAALNNLRFAPQTQLLATGPGHRSRPQVPVQATDPGYRSWPQVRATGPGHRSVTILAQVSAKVVWVLTCPPNSRRDALPWIAEALGPRCPPPNHPPTQPATQPPIHQPATCLATHPPSHPANQPPSQPPSHRSAKPSPGHKSWPQVPATGPDHKSWPQVRATGLDHRSWPQVRATSLSLPDGGSYAGADLAEAAGAEAASHHQEPVQSLAEHHPRRKEAPCQQALHVHDAQGRLPTTCGTSTNTAQEGASAAQPGKRNMWQR